MSRNNQTGFAHIGILVLVVIIAAVAFVGWRVYEKSLDTNEAPATTQTENQSSEPPEVNNADDLEDAENYVNEQDIDGQLDTSEIDSSLNE